MFKNYKGLWAILLVAFGVFAVVSAFDEPVKIGKHELKSSKIVQTLTAQPDTTSQAGVTAGTANADNGAAQGGGQTAVAKTVIPAPTDTASKTILFIGDSMLDGLSPRLAAYAKQNGHTLYSVIWYSSHIEVWAKSGKLSQYINDLHPDFIFVCLGSNELFIKDIKDKRQKYLDQLIAQIGDIPYVWIGPPNWKPDTGINDMLVASNRPGSFFMSNGMHFERRKDGAHPTRESAALWMDSVARWIPGHAAHPIKMEAPDANLGKATAKRTILHQPDEIKQFM